MTLGTSRIHLLSDLVANKIAAGEVVERPASVLKELVENSIDAGARHIDVDLVAGGKKLMAVTDDGSGMGRDDALLCIERHATSKIRDVQDIERIATLGFRGEALAAISAVSQFTLKTRLSQAPEGSELIVNGGKIVDVRDTGCPVGTRIEVRNLFFNVSARRKFLRSEATEQAFLKQMFMVFALAHPPVGFQLVSDGRSTFQLAGDASLDVRIGELFGRDYLRQLCSVDREAGGLKVVGYAGLPNQTRTDRSEQYVFINGRASSAPLISFAIQEAYRDMVPRGRYAPIFLFLELDPSQVDVNVHPTKKEVRFRNPSMIRDPLIEIIRLALSGSGATGVLDAAAVKGSDPQDLRPQVFSAAPRQQTFPYPQMPAHAIQPGLPSSVGGMPFESKSVAPQQVESQTLWKWCRVLGQAGGFCLVLETDEGIVLMDPQAAHERVIYDRLMAGALDGQAQSQSLLAPENVELKTADAQHVRECLEVLRAMGFGIAEFGGDAFIVDRLPVSVDQGRIGDLLADIAHEIDQGGARRGMLHGVEEMVARAASRLAVAGGTRLAEAEVEQLIRDLSSTEMPYTCPHGRPTMIFMGFQELARKFGREK
ncbi:MAG: DNA mismatch repair endonuclease MutL [Lentisphaerota bacterium]